MPPSTYASARHQLCLRSVTSSDGTKAWHIHCAVIVPRLIPAVWERLKVKRLNVMQTTWQVVSIALPNVILTIPHTKKDVFDERRRII